MSAVKGHPIRQAGFNLLELMITVTVMAILLAIAVPTFRELMHRNQVTSASNELLATVAYARTEAINRGQLVSLCPSADNGASCSGESAYETGWMVYTYPAGAASVNKAYDATVDVLLRVTTPRQNVSIRTNRDDVITFGQQGQLRPSTPLAFETCYRPGPEGSEGESTTKVLGIRLDVNGSGSSVTKPMPISTTCTPS